MKSSESYKLKNNKECASVFIYVPVCVCVSFMIAYRQLFFMALAYDYGPGARV